METVFVMFLNYWDVATGKMRLVPVQVGNVHDCLVKLASPFLAPFLPKLARAGSTPHDPISMDGVGADVYPSFEVFLGAYGIFQVTGSYQTPVNGFDPDKVFAYLVATNISFTTFQSWLDYLDSPTLSWALRPGQGVDTGLSTSLMERITRADWGSTFCRLLED